MQYVEYIDDCALADSDRVADNVAPLPPEFTRFHYLKNYALDITN
jgi:hypothetical protein